MLKGRYVFYNLSLSLNQEIIFAFPVAPKIWEQTKCLELARLTYGVDLHMGYHTQTIMAIIKGSLDSSSIYTQSLTLTFRTLGMIQLGK